jgi:hypothetical protein
VRQRCAFTTHTPVAAGNDEFNVDLLKRCFVQLWQQELISAKMSLFLWSVEPENSSEPWADAVGNSDVLLDQRRKLKAWRGLRFGRSVAGKDSRRGPDHTHYQWSLCSYLGRTVDPFGVQEIWRRLATSS